MTILIIEPDKILGKAIQNALETAGHKISWCRSAQKAIDSLDEELPDLIILELQLGIHNGIEFLYELRSYVEWQNIPVVIHTINTKALDDIFAPSLAQLNVKAVLYKPRTSTAKLVQAVRQLVPLI